LKVVLQTIAISKKKSFVKAFIRLFYKNFRQAQLFIGYNDGV